MKGARRVSYRMLVSRVKSEIPELYRALALNLYNPCADQCMLGKLASAGQNGQFRTPKHIREMMVDSAVRTCLKLLT